MQDIAPAWTYAEEIQNKPNYLKIICNTNEFLQPNNPFYQEYHVKAENLKALMIKHTTGNNTNDIYVENQLLK